ncbi:AAA family ATPase [Oceanicoccus sp. KOV_DT_Chl]|uniref:AAA family ATPase n=1 Tax=Oceanicoccus sp. KOV_DT_Chl TaxID=1904639 RepID=UPI000C7C7C4F|nr:AAA family ATPase [Oceanicoccus sp. KOV_DT_Chl]
MAYFLGIAGTHSTGKSTFIETVENQAKAIGISVIRISDTATKCQAAGFPILENHTFESTLWIIVSVIKAELEAELSADLVLVDRPVLDALGYLEAALKATERSLTSEERSYLYDLVKNHSKRYALLLKTTLDESIPVGGGRDANMVFRRDASLEIDHVFNHLDVPYLDPNANITQNRIQRIFEKICAKKEI